MAKKLLIIFAFLFIFTGCNKNEDVDDSRPVVYASFYPVKSIVESVTGDRINVKSFMPTDQDPHMWEPTSKDMARLDSADLLVVNGANMERWLDQVRENLPDLKVLVLSESVDLISYKGASDLGDFQYMTKLNLKKGENYNISFGHTHENLLRLCMFKYNGEKEDELVKKAKKLMEKKGKVIKQKRNIELENEKVYAIEMGHESGKVSYEVPEPGEWIFVSDRISEEILSYDLLDSNNNLLEKEDLLTGSSSSLDKVTYDPHSWLSLVNAKKYYNAIYDELREIYPEYERAFQKNKVKEVEKITMLEFDYKKKFKELKSSDKEKREFVTTHNAYGYVARDFDLKQFPLSDLVSTESPSLKTIKTAINFCRINDIKTIFYELGSSSKEADSLAEDVGAKSEALISMEYEHNLIDLEDKSYTAIMEENLKRLYEGMK